MKGQELLFVLDIGTRSVIGVVGRVQEEMFEVLCVESVEHSARAVIDGQIEDIEQTAKVAGQVKARLEEQIGLPLTEVHVAAAGRMLKTEHVIHEVDLDPQQPIDIKKLVALEAGAVQEAYEKLAAGLQETDPTDFCNVGHSAVQYQVDGYSFSTLLGHRGKRASVEMIATFLPSEVVESLYATMSMLGLSIASMTLEPIAAMNAVVPKELRLLNVALVDVGAGTSDIAVADKGSVCGYTMATMAGDEVTEQLMQNFLVDFSMAEQMKFDASAGKQTIEYEDVLGIPNAVELEELLEQMHPIVETLAQQIADRILQVNGNPPKAVFMVGGGSQTPGLCQLVAKALSIDEKRVAAGGTNYMKRQVQADKRYLSAEYATPIGIGITAMAAGRGESLSVSLNGVKLHLMGSSMTVMEALRLGGYQYGQIMGRSGKSMVFQCNGERRMVRGGIPALAEIQVNGELAGLSVLLQPGDEITFVPAKDGADAAPLLREVAPGWSPFQVEWLGEPMTVGSLGWINGVPAQGDQLIQPMDQVIIRQIDTVGDLLILTETQGDDLSLAVNGVPCTDFEQKLHAGDRIDFLGKDASRQGIAPAASLDKPKDLGLHIQFNEKACIFPPKEGGYQLFHLFNYVDIDPQDSHGDIVLLRNGATASFLDPIQDGDRVEIHWSQEDASDRIPQIPDSF